MTMSPDTASAMEAHTTEISKDYSSLSFLSNSVNTLLILSAYIFIAVLQN